MNSFWGVERRELLLVDVENLCGGAGFGAGDVAAVRDAVTAHVGKPAVQAVVATSHGAGLVVAGLGWPGARLVWRPGHDGADLALADVALNEQVTARYDRVIICSGDGLFAMVARHLAQHGVHVSVVARRGSLSRALALAAHDVYLLDGALGQAA